jgi:hypothetical protein
VEDFLQEKLLEVGKDVITLPEGLVVSLFVEKLPHLLDVFYCLLHHVLFVDAEICHFLGATY